MANGKDGALRVLRSVFGQPQVDQAFDLANGNGAAIFVHQQAILCLLAGEEIRSLAHHVHGHLAHGTDALDFLRFFGHHGIQENLVLEEAFKEQFWQQLLYTRDERIERPHLALAVDANPPGGYPLVDENLLQAQRHRLSLVTGRLGEEIGERVF